jgi:hypothetical protein
VHPLTVHIIKRLVFDDPAISGTGTCSTNGHNTKDKTEKIHYKWFRAQPILNAYMHVLRFS